MPGSTPDGGFGRRLLADRRRRAARRSSTPRRSRSRPARASATPAATSFRARASATWICRSSAASAWAATCKLEVRAEGFNMTNTAQVQHPEPRTTSPIGTCLRAEPAGGPGQRASVPSRPALPVLASEPQHSAAPQSHRLSSPAGVTSSRAFFFSGACVRSDMLRRATLHERAVAAAIAAVLAGLAARRGGAAGSPRPSRLAPPLPVLTLDSFQPRPRGDCATRIARRRRARTMPRPSDGSAWCCTRGSSGRPRR